MEKSPEYTSQLIQMLKQEQKKNSDLQELVAVMTVKVSKEEVIMDKTKIVAVGYFNDRYFLLLKDELNIRAVSSIGRICLLLQIFGITTHIFDFVRLHIVKENMHMV